MVVVVAGNKFVKLKEGLGISLDEAVSVATGGPDADSLVNGKPSFDCSKATSASARLICSDTNLSKVDGVLGTKFKALVGDKDEATKSQLIQQQLLWLRARNSRCGVGPDKAGVSVEQLAEAKPCMLDAINKRIAELAGARNNSSPSSSGTFSSPSAYCKAVRTIDAPDTRYTGPATTEEIEKTVEYSGSGTIEWRCLNSEVYACITLNSRVCGKFGAHNQASLKEFCSQNPDAPMVPAFAAGHDPVSWACEGTKPKMVAGNTRVDARGFPVGNWQRVQFGPDAKQTTPDTNNQKEAVAAALRSQMQSGNKLIMRDGVIVDGHALQNWTDPVYDIGGETLLKYDNAKNQWMIIVTDGGGLDVQRLVSKGVPQSLATLVTNLQQLEAKSKIARTTNAQNPPVASGGTVQAAPKDKQTNKSPIAGDQVLLGIQFKVQVGAYWDPYLPQPFGGVDKVSIVADIDTVQQQFFIDEQQTTRMLNYLRTAAIRSLEQQGARNIPSVVAVHIGRRFEVPWTFTAFVKDSGSPWAISNNQQAQMIRANIAAQNAQAEQARQQAQQQALLRERIAQGNLKQVSTTGRYSDEVSQCVKQFFPSMGFSAPMVAGSPCSNFIRVDAIETMDSRELPNGILEVLTKITVEALQQLNGGSMIANACGIGKTMLPGDRVWLESRIQFEKWNSGLRCTSKNW